MCYKNVSWCEFCHFERLVDWERCTAWKQTFRREVKYTGLFSQPPVPSPSSCPNAQRVVILLIRPGSCPSGPPPGFVREERLRRRGYARHFGYPDDSDDADLNDDTVEAPFGVRGSAVHGCVGYEVRARLRQSGAEQWEEQWQHRNLRARMGLEPCGEASERFRYIRKPQPVPMLSGVPPSNLETLPEGVAPDGSKPSFRNDPLPPRKMPIAWTHNLARPPPVLRRRRRLSGPYDPVFSDDEENEDDNSSLDIANLSLGTDSEAASPAPIALSPQPQRRRSRAMAIVGGRENLDLVMPHVAEPQQQQQQQQPLTSEVPSEYLPGCDKPDDVNNTPESNRPAPANTFEEQNRPRPRTSPPFQRPRTYSPRVKFAMPKPRRRRGSSNSSSCSYEPSHAVPVPGKLDKATMAQLRRGLKPEFDRMDLVPNWDWGRFRRWRF